MSWKDSLQPGKFREVPFLFESTDGEIGRRVVIHEYPLRDLPYAEDLGRKARRFTLEIYVLGADYMKGRDALISAIEKPGQGTLVHPYLGALQVAVAEARGPRESTREGGMARFSVTFVEAGENRFPQTKVDTRSAVKTKAVTARTAIKAEFIKKFSVLGSASFVVARAGEVAKLAATTVRTLSARIPSVLPAEAAMLAANLTTLSGQATTLIRTPAEFAEQLLSNIVGLSGLPADLIAGPHQALGLYRALATFGVDLPVVPRTTPSRIQQANNQAALIALVQQAAVIEMAEASTAVTFDSYDAAVALRDELARRLETVAETADDTVYTALGDLRVDIVRDISTRGGELARVTTRSFGASLPALVIAQRVYVDASRDLEIVRRNRVRHPGFVPGGTTLELLNA